MRFSTQHSRFPHSLLSSPLGHIILSYWGCCKPKRMNQLDVKWQHLSISSPYQLPLGRRWRPHCHRSGVERPWRTLQSLQSTAERQVLVRNHMNGVAWNKMVLSARSHKAHTSSCNMYIKFWDISLHSNRTVWGERGREGSSLSPNVAVDCNKWIIADCN